MAKRKTKTPKSKALATIKVRARRLILQCPGLPVSGQPALYRRNTGDDFEMLPEDAHRSRGRGDVEFSEVPRDIVHSDAPTD